MGEGPAASFAVAAAVAVAGAAVVAVAVGVPLLLPLRVPHPLSCKAGSSACVGAAFSFHCHPEPIRAKRGWVRDLLLP